MLLYLFSLLVRLPPASLSATLCRQAMENNDACVVGCLTDRCLPLPEVD